MTIPLSLAFALASAQSVAPPPSPTPPVAQTEPASDEDAAEDDAATDDAAADEIVVTGQRQRGAVAGDIAPEIQLDRRDIRALGAGSLAELLTAIAPQTRSGRGRDGGGPVLLLNGRRTSGFAELRDIPPEAIERADILPEEVALKYGFRADQRVVNFVLRRRFRALTAEVEGGLPTAGGRLSSEVDLNLLRIDNAGRWSLDAEYSHDTSLLESERDIEQAVNAPLDESRFRTLLPESDRLTLGGTLNRGLPGDISATVNARYDEVDTRSLFGLATGATKLPSDGGPNPLMRDSRSRNAGLALSFNGDVQPWRWSLAANLDRNASTSLTDTDSLADPRGRDRARSVDQSADARLVVNGPLFSLPAGRVTTSIRVGAAMRDFSSDSFRGGIVQTADLSRDRADIQASFDVPIASRSDGVLSAIGDLSANVNYAADRLSDFGTLTTLGYGLNWQPIEQVRILASVTDEDGAPTVQQLGNPVIAQANARVFDFTRQETVDVIRIEGGNPDLVADSRQVMKLGLSVQPLKETQLTVSADYTDTRIRDVITGFPTVTPEIEAAFPDRFTRDAGGRLLRIDSRPVNFTRLDREELRYGFNLSRPFGTPDPASAGGPGAGRRGQAAGGQGAGAAGQPRPDGARRGPGARGGAGRGPGGFGRGGGGFGGRGGFGGPRGVGNLQLALYHTVRLTDTILIRDGVPELDLLDGSAVGNRGGRSRHEVELQAGVFKNGFGGRLTANYQSGTNVLGRADTGADTGAGTGTGTGTGGTTGDGGLSFGSLATFNLRLFADLGAQEKLVARYPFLRGARISLVADNIFDSRLSVRDGTGLTPLGYQPDLLDPLGRSVRISLRKLFLPNRQGRRGALGRAG